MIKTYKLSNGMKIIHIPKKVKGVFVSMNVKIGSNYENPKIRGISHFLEHMMFEGTKTRTTKEISKEIEDVGGLMNAATSNERTYYYIYLMKKYFVRALDVLSDMIKNPKFGEKEFNKERKIVLDELHMTKDDPKVYQWDLFMSKLFKKHPARHPIIGYKRTVSKIKHKDIVNFYKKYYVPSNMALIVVGNVPHLISKVKKYFGDFSDKKINIKRHFKEVGNVKQTKFTEKQELKDSYILLGYKTCPAGSKDSYVLEVIQSILGRGQSARLFDEFRIKRGIGYIVSAHNDVNKDFGLFAVNVSTNKKNLKLCEDLINQVLKLEGLTSRELKDAKDFIEGHFLLKMEDSRDLGDWIGFWDLIDLKKSSTYLKNIKKVTIKDVKRVVNKYFTDKYTMVVLEQRK